MAADQIAGKDADLKRATKVEAECRQFETSISDMLNAVDAAGTQMTTMANAMAADRAADRRPVDRRRRRPRSSPRPM